LGQLSEHESIVWREFQKGKPTGQIAEEHSRESWSPAYISKVLNKARSKIRKLLEEQALSHRLDVESLLDYKGLLIGFDYQANSQVYIAYTEKLGVVVWYKHESFAGKLCQSCPKEADCRETLDVLMSEYDIQLRADEEALPMTLRSIAIFNRLAAKESPRYRRKEEEN
jgi:hypothetical protein